MAKRNGDAIRISLKPDFAESRYEVYPEAAELFDKIVVRREKATPEEQERLMQVFKEMSIRELEYLRRRCSISNARG